jgi:hypothetical protein
VHFRIVNFKNKKLAMEVIIALPIIIIPFFFPVLSGLMAISFGRKFWPWFIVGVFLPFISMIILLALPDRRKKKEIPVSDEEIFDPLLNNHKSRYHAGHKVYFSAKA